MRLLNTFLLQLEEFADDAIPEYAILSHTWGTEEVSLQEMKQMSSKGIPKSRLSRPIKWKTGYSKIKGACDIAAQHGLSYIWIDTCCIDKTSSAELTESINSMYRWYRNAKVCYAYLGDVPNGVDLKAKESIFTKSRWFTRGWTLQELIAPSAVLFFSQNWFLIGSKAVVSEPILESIGLHTDRLASLAEEISTITGIDIGVLKGENPQLTSIAKRMFWASERRTTRSEDIAYCLMGLFDVNMPLLYGEGNKAFTRLQEEILKYSDDHSLFAWDEVPGPNAREYSGLLAQSPACFAGSRYIASGHATSSLKADPYNITNRGLRINLPISILLSKAQLFAAELNCDGTIFDDKIKDCGSRVIFLQKIHPAGDQFIRVHQLENTTKDQLKPEYERAWGNRTIYVLENIVWKELVRYKEVLRGSETCSVLKVYLPKQMESTDYNWSHVYPLHNWNMQEHTLGLDLKGKDEQGLVHGAILYRSKTDGKSFVLFIGYSSQVGVAIWIDTDYTLKSLVQGFKSYEAFSAENRESPVLETDSPISGGPHVYAKVTRTKPGKIVIRLDLCHREDLEAGVQRQREHTRNELWAYLTEGLE